MYVRKSCHIVLVVLWVFVSICVGIVRGSASLIAVLESITDVRLGASGSTEVIAGRSWRIGPILQSAITRDKIPSHPLNGRSDLKFKVKIIQQPSQNTTQLENH